MRFHPPLILEALFFLWCTLPFLWYEIQSRGWTAKNELERPLTQNNLSLVYLLPIWNEERLIERKLNDLARHDVSASLLIIDSASTDRTLSRVQGWLSSHNDVFTKVEVITMPKRLGKSAAVQQALEFIETEFHHDLICMTDADALIENGTISKLKSWFDDNMIGAVGALPHRSSTRSDEDIHRSYWDQWRIRESYYDSTPFLEGSCMMWRSKLLQPTDIRTNSNADDAQIALAIRSKGYRTIVDREAQFTDVAPWSRNEQAQQKIRRGQGLQRVLLRYRNVILAQETGHFRRIFRMQFHALIIAPLLIVLTIAVMLVRWVQYLIFGTPTPLFDTMITGVEVLFLLGLFFIRYIRTSIPLFSVAGTWFSSMLYLQRGLFDIVRGKSHHMWDQLSEPRLEHE